MKFTPESSYGFGSATSLTDEDVRQLNKSSLQYRTILYSFVRPTAEYESDKNPKLDTTWYHFIFFRGGEIYEFRSYKDFIITETDIEETDQDLTNIVKATHNLLRKNFEERRIEYPIFDSISEISDDTIQQTVRQLRTSLLQRQQ